MVWSAIAHASSQYFFEQHDSVVLPSKNCGAIYMFSLTLKCSRMQYFENVRSKTYLKISKNQMQLITGYFTGH